MNNDVKHYFEVTARRFDALYGERGEQLFNRVFRSSIYERTELTIGELAPYEGRTFLDVGCGSGIHAVSLAERGANIVGVDFSRPMLNLAKDRADMAGVSSQCTFIEADFLELNLTEKFDGVYSLGVFDYISEPERLLRAMMDCTSGKVICAFPKPTLLRAPLRKLRYGLKDCPVYFYSKRRIHSLFAAVGDPAPKILPLRGAWLAVGQGQGGKVVM